jgi:tetraacyldisaccharide 4'-kinase
LQPSEPPAAADIAVPADARITSLVTSAWQRRGVFAWLLAPLALLFYATVAVRRWVYRRGWLPTTRVAVPVIVIGNLYVGGTGKTPLTIEVVRALKRRGWTPGVVSRGYGGRELAARLVKPDDRAGDVGDEPLLIGSATGAPVAVGARRASAAQLLLQAHPACDVVIADDGLQHLPLARDIELALIDERLLGNGWVLPAGPLREPPGRLATVEAIVLHGDMRVPAGRVPCFRMHSQLADRAYRLGDRSELVPLAELAGRQQAAALAITAAAGIGVPQRFFDMLRAAGLRIEAMPLPDHYDFRDDPFRACRSDLLLITEKDAVKCERVDALRNDSRIWVVALQATVDAALVDFIDARLNTLRKSPHGSSAA